MGGNTVRALAGGNETDTPGPEEESHHPGSRTTLAQVLGPAIALFGAFSPPEMWPGPRR